MEKKQNSIEKIFTQIKDARNDKDHWNDSMLVDWLLDQENYFKLMHKKEIIDATIILFDESTGRAVYGSEYYNKTYGETKN